MPLLVRVLYLLTVYSVFNVPERMRKMHPSDNREVFRVFYNPLKDIFP